jgi:transcription antitermination protein NusB
MNKATGRRKSRELALQMLFQFDMAKQNADEVRRTFWAERMDLDQEIRAFADELFNLASGLAEEVDEIIIRNANWRLDRMPAVDRNVLRVGVAECLGHPETARPIIINEALEIARKFSTPESVVFINGVLDSVARELPEVKKPRASTRKP